MNWYAIDLSNGAISNDFERPITPIKVTPTFDVKIPVMVQDRPIYRHTWDN